MEGRVLHAAERRAPLDGVSEPVQVREGLELRAAEVQVPVHEVAQVPPHRPRAAGEGGGAVAEATGGGARARRILMRPPRRALRNSRLPSVRFVADDAVTP
eukprot:30864-Pelagococcus_subviridis.AAC.1